MKEQPIERTSLFPKEEIIHTNIEHIEILEILSNDNIVIDDKAGIENISSFLMKLNSDNIDNANEDDISNKPIYHIYINNIGRHANPTIAVYKNSITYNGKEQGMTSEESLSLIQLIDKIRK
ncbi:MAG: hypothetical protein KKF57_12680 [Firmicutes bacterium]|nr:hypothetical protein [Bacillota bacterium]